MYHSLYCKGSKRVTQCLRVRGSWRPNITAILWPPLWWPSTLCLSRSPGLLDQRPRGPLSWVLAFFTASYQQLLWTLTQSGALSPFGLVWFSLPDLVYNSVQSLTVWLLSWLSYIIVQHPLSRLFDLWNGMFDRHQAEITVMQFTGHSLPVHQSMSVPWDFLYLAPFHQPNPAYAISFDYWPLGYDTSFRCITLEWHILAGSRVKIQQIK